jgi:hypothetical protein
MRLFLWLPGYAGGGVTGVADGADVAGWGVSGVALGATVTWGWDDGAEGAGVAWAAGVALGLCN